MIYLDIKGNVCLKSELIGKPYLNLNNIYLIELPDGAKLPDWDRLHQGFLNRLSSTAFLHLLYDNSEVIQITILARVSVETFQRVLDEYDINSLLYSLSSSPSLFHALHKFNRYDLMGVMLQIGFDLEGVIQKRPSKFCLQFPKLTDRSNGQMILAPESADARRCALLIVKYFLENNINIHAIHIFAFDELELYEIDPDFRNMVQETAAYLPRKSYLKFIEGCQEAEGECADYLLDDLTSRDICSYLYRNEDCCDKPRHRANILLNDLTSRDICTYLFPP